MSLNACPLQLSLLHSTEFSSKTEVSANLCCDNNRLQPQPASCFAPSLRSWLTHLAWHYPPVPQPEALLTQLQSFSLHHMHWFSLISIPESAFSHVACLCGVSRPASVSPSHCTRIVTRPFVGDVCKSVHNDLTQSEHCPGQISTLNRCEYDNLYYY